MQHVVLTPKPPQQLFVGSVEGEPTCTPDLETYEIWPKLLVMVLLGGTQHFVIDDKPFQIDAGTGENATPTVVMLNVARAAKLRFLNDSGTPLRKVQISAPRPWLEWLMRTQTKDKTVLKRFLGRHLASFSFSPSRQIVTLAEQLMHPPSSMQDELYAFYRNSRGLDILTVACSVLIDQYRNTDAPRIVTLRQSERIRDYIMGNLDQDLTIDGIAKEVGASASSVQRHFKTHFGVTVFEFIRDQRLERANQALEQDGVSIAQAAYIAGYSNAAHFATAFKRTYGVSPSSRRR
jgi:AraC-like DNA-binding protein